jgi:hypothetical protein
MTLSPDTNEVEEQAREHAWNWFALHGAQRMQAFNFFFVATAFLIAAYASVLEKYPMAAIAIAGVGAWLTFWFNLLDARNKQLVKAGEEALKISQARLATLADNPRLKILDAVEHRNKWLKWTSYGRVITVIQVTVLVLFLAGIGYAVRLIMTDKLSCLA